VLWLNSTVEMTAGKAMAQAGHAAQLAWWRLPEADQADWRAGGFDLAVRTASAQRWSLLLTSDLPVVRDGGFTEVEPGTCTVIADHPSLRQRLGPWRVRDTNVPRQAVRASCRKKPASQGSVLHFEMVMAWVRASATYRGARGRPGDPAEPGHTGRPPGGTDDSGS
jgi:peptidyl-tRNA hydrolase